MKREVIDRTHRPGLLELNTALVFEASFQDFTSNATLLQNQVHKIQEHLCKPEELPCSLKFLAYVYIFFPEQ